MTLAKAFVTGVVVKKPEVRFTQNDMAMADFTINIDANNETLLRVVIFGNLATAISSTVAPGDSVVVEGRLQVNSYKLPNGKDKKIFEISASAVEKMSAGAGVTNPVATDTAATNPAAANIKSSENIVSFNQDEIAQDLIDEEEIPF